MEWPASSMMTYVRPLSCVQTPTALPWESSNGREGLALMENGERFSQVLHSKVAHNALESLDVVPSQILQHQARSLCNDDGILSTGQHHDTRGRLFDSTCQQRMRRMRGSLIRCWRLIAAREDLVGIALVPLLMRGMDVILQLCIVEEGLARHFGVWITQRTVAGRVRDGNPIWKKCVAFISQRSSLSQTSMRLQGLKAGYLCSVKLKKV